MTFCRNAPLRSIRGKADMTLRRERLLFLMLWTAPTLRHQECHRVVA